MDYDNENANPFGSDRRKQILEEMMQKGLIKRITLIEGHYPTSQAQKAFLGRIIDWVRGVRNS